jgi:hypothetical protein
MYFELDYGRDAAEIMKYNRNGQNSLVMFKPGRKGNWSKSFIVIITDSISYYDAFGLHEVIDKQGRVGT